ARREAAIDAALRRFDGVEDAVRVKQPQPTWARTHRTQLGFALSILLIVTVGIPAGLIGLRQEPAAQNTPLPEVAHISECAGNRCEREPTGSSPALDGADRRLAPSASGQKVRVPEDALPAAKSIAHSTPAQSLQPAPDNQPPAEVGAPVVAAAPPPPPPPPAPVASAERDAESPGGQDLVVTGSRIAEPNLTRREASRQQKANAFAARTQSYGEFLSDLQRAVRADNRTAIVAMAALPLRVTVGGRTRTYRNAASVKRDFDRIFNDRVRQAILDERPNRLSTSDDGAKIGKGEVWLARSSPASSVRIVAVNP
ncbi:MAG: hypothetical protein QOE50_1102, partial [Sphingomonadales bacterium]|nr:hypothetical protein [Sphingomonadales bacterium]